MPEVTKKWVIFTDLDGSLLDHNTYRWDEARPWLNRLRSHRVPVVITTSKTAAEIMPIQQELALHDMPAIAENGADILLPASWQKHTSVPPICRTYPDICRQLQALRELHGFLFCGFADMDDAAVAAVTGLTLSQAALARRRTGSEPVLWQGDSASLAMFRVCLTQKQLSVTEGGRFFHVMHEGISKGVAVNWLKQHIESTGNSPLVTLGLGDGPNDISLLEATDYAVIIKGHASNKVTLSPSFCGQSYRTQAAGPAGWSEGLTYFLSRYGAELLD
ncbi:mannosyl-3-phosphoglycerate phosphatase-related protein [Dickeya dianthicola]|uniref:mannosyl-3-phosphoglycerate phosphatase-related protein n=1 Tax=Dickeya dianthicola TaxID=204039 RepID=UPI001BDDFA3E|nr:mannosyl-3-phosphoglycerate phosphatase-related protein [Dickeya dianthicola]MBT1428128.1 mannosyl-3-phosphoglycerate phosphatase-related protein [Dickeya dianthicola]MBT1459642.1 mannosyl-3-phosphoglycerate phosphatase-related protein [Dickeya dianthicola]MBT1488840.1 mannosyl-3-phosphoglycerate phosphatase-related protein [Dickeya dianthicola]MCI4031380.1 mannosyl-3-phosphoglycerate phosphatase-related protein [Dickeya dianthicola]MCI4171708.1 mannosyl-3-phosphoglycerate phosphatase-relat